MSAVRPASAAPAAACTRCRHFHASPGGIEQRLRGLWTLSSAYGSVRSQDGLCERHDRYVAGSSSCEAFQPA